MGWSGQYRYLTLRHEQRLLSGKEPDLLPGEARFHSYYKPSLTAGKHHITVIQQVTAPEGYADEPQDADAQRSFTVLAPQWTLPDGTVASVFPPPGHSAQFRTLPHVVLRDPHLPWARRVSGKSDGDDKGCIPWMALVAFTVDELQLDDALQKAFFPAGTGAKLNDNLGWDLEAGNVKSVANLAPGRDRLTNFLPEAATRDAQVKTSVIAVKRDTFVQLFADRGANQCDVSKFKFMSHVRKVATEGMLSAVDGESGTFGMVVSHRTGPLEVAQPVPVMVHLVSLEKIDNLPLVGIKDRVLLTSLYSWSYTALPPDSFDVSRALKHLGTAGKGLTVLRPDRTRAPDKTTPRGTELSVDDIISRRQQDGYSLLRHRTVTGEATAAICRGPLVPTIVPHPLHPDVPFQSNFGSDLQILDRELGLMDVSYAAAWQLGKMLAMGDPAFTAALARLRATVHKTALSKAKDDVYRHMGAYESRNDTLSALPDAIAGLNRLNDFLHASGDAPLATNRWRRRPDLRATNAAVDTSLRSEHIFSQMYEQASEAALCASLAADGSGLPYNYHTVPANTDYAAVQEWVLDKLHLANIPPHYFLPDPCYLPEETLRFFYVDENWTDALVDGALSLANHFTDVPADDYCRIAIKERLNKYLRTPIKGLGYCQQMPAYGFILRSQLLVQFPDLAVQATMKPPEFKAGGDSWDKVKPKAPILVQRRLESDMMLCLFDREPPDLVSLEFVLPAHQQTFVVASDLTRDTIKVAYSKIYASKKPETDVDKRRLALGTREIPTSDLFDWEARTLKVSEYATNVHNFLEKNMDDKQYIETGATAAVLALQLNEPIHTLLIDVAPEQQKPGASTSRGGVSGDDDDWELVPRERPQFQFHVPAFPAHKYAPTQPLPAPVQTPRPEPVQLWQQKKQQQRAPARRVAQPSRKATEDWNGLPPLPLPAPPLDPPAPYPLDKPEFTLRVYPSSMRNRTSIPTDHALPQDLIFSITVPRRGQFSYWLSSLEIRVTLGEKDDPKLPPPDDAPLVKPRPLLQRSRADDGQPPPYMLSNMRFNVLRSWDTARDQLVLTVVSRTLSGANMLTFEEAGFVLPMVRVVEWEREYVAQVDMWSSFRGRQEKEWSHGVKVRMGPEGFRS